MKLLNYITMIIYMGSLTAMLGTTSCYAVTRDPTRPINYEGESSVPWELNGIIIAKDRRVAVINGVSVQIGDTINNYKVISIDPGIVLLDGEEGKMTLKLIQQPVRYTSDHK